MFIRKILLVFILSLFIKGLYAEDSLKVSAFADAQLQLREKRTLTPGFLINDAALYISKTVDNASFNIDIPFFGGDADTNDFQIAVAKAQAYVDYSVSGLKLTIGQFDTIYGFELNDTKDVTFSTQGIVFNGALPVTHLGLAAAYDIYSMLGVRALVSNPNNQGTLNGGNPEFGLQIYGDSEDMFRYVLGFLVRTEGSNTPHLIDLVIGKTLGALVLDLEFDYLKTISLDDAGLAVMLNAVYQLSDKLSVALRPEFMSKVSNYQDVQFTVGAQYALSDALTLKTDYTINMLKESSTSLYSKGHALNFAMVFSL